MLLGLTLLALAAVPDSVVPIPAPVDSPDQFLAWQRENSQPPFKLLACDKLWVNEALLCFKVSEGKQRRWVTQADLQTWGTDLPGLRKWAESRAKGEIASLQKADIEGMNASYWVANTGIGWAMAGVLSPADLTNKIGAKQVFVGMPAEGVLMAWVPANAEVNLAMAVGVREVFDETKKPVTPMVHRWDGERWTTFAEATPHEVPK